MSDKDGRPSFGCSCANRIAELDRQLAAEKAARHEAESILTSATDLTNSKARADLARMREHLNGEETAHKATAFALAIERERLDFFIDWITNPQPVGARLSLPPQNHLLTKPERLIEWRAVIDAAIRDKR